MMEVAGPGFVLQVANPGYKDKYLRHQSGTMGLFARFLNEMLVHRSKLPLFFLYHAILQSIRAINHARFMFFIRMAPPDGPAVTLPDGIKLFIKPDCTGISRDLFIDPTRERLCNAWLDELGDGDVAVDVGANIGFYALKQSRRVGPKGRVFAIEPASPNRHWLEKNLSANRCENVSVHPLAIGDRTGNGLIHINRKCNLTNMLGPSFGEVIATQDVRVSTLDDFLASEGVTPDFIRMDVEGYEYNVLKGAMKTLRAPKAMRLMVEFHPDLMGRDKAVYFLQTLQKLGFGIERIAVGNALYPDVKPDTPMHALLLRMWCALSGTKYRPAFCKVISGMTIRDFLNDREMMSGRLGCPNILFRKPAGVRGSES